MCEPGRALVAHAVSVVTQVQLRKDDQLYINDGVYGSLSETVDAGVKLPARAHRLTGALTGAPKDFILNGPTCDSLDVLPSTFSLPSDIDEGDWIEIDRVGAYSNALATRFNGFTPGDAGGRARPVDRHRALMAMRQKSFPGSQPRGLPPRRLYRMGRSRRRRATIVCCHGLTRNGRDFDALAAALCRDARVICPDIVGRGAAAIGCAIPRITAIRNTAPT